MSEVKPPAPPKPARSPVEKAIVWGVIGIGVLVIAVEANAHMSHSGAQAKLLAQLDASVNKNEGMRKSHVDQIVGSKIPVTQKLGFLQTSMAASRVDIYSYPALLRSRKLYIYYGIDGKQPGQEAEVMEVLTVEAPTAEQAYSRSRGPENGGKGAGGPGGPGSGTGGGMGGGRGKGGGRPDKAGQPGAEDAKPTEGTEPATDKKADDVKPEETKSEDSKPEADKPAETKPEDAKPEETKPAETEPKKE